ncbi:hypothetical protein SAMD00019534_095850 [Acytostelium subglobosum LB1]|uniref:hypothetical protein n=1 Tax=Acytostelium subglobosum LB1 TaxID=1410327 RepID=UPI0006448CC2|nr:hypothetical protein SAMD00019534_095850 [Acytostelium subglobosum LB1]GAM26410.1 hypothetical protein SAMD00019534_095850 [Acytostelium subglobosum LB1]|eukprot:XP_012750506.1 hypothetical protein SAMD00019534_095850 [Acytostelium subglobosum LB1]
MGQQVSKDAIKEEIEGTLSFAILSQHHENQNTTNNNNNTATCCCQKGLIQRYYYYLSKKKDNGYIDEFIKPLDKSVLLRHYINEEYEEQLRQREALHAPQAKQQAAAAAAIVGKKLDTKKDIIDNKDDNNDNNEDTTNKDKVKRSILYDAFTIESAQFDGEEIFLHIIQKQHPQTFEPTLYERVLVPQSVQLQFKLQPNESLSSWEYFDELNSTPIFYQINPLYNMINSDNYTVQEKGLTRMSVSSRDQSIKEYLSSIIQSFSTYITPLPNSIHFHDSSIPPSIDYSAPNLLRIHPNILPILEVLESDKNFIITHKKYPFSLDCLLRYSSQFLVKNSKITAFILYQLIQVISFLHEKEIIHGDLSPASVFLDEHMWLGLHGFTFPRAPKYYVVPPNSDPLDSTVNLWVNGQISNFNYLLLLNHLAHRRPGDHINHPVLPWVIDFARHPFQAAGGWRDLTKTKYRLNKGDEQLDFQFNNAPGGINRPHHISDILSELTYYSYMARRTPVPLLRRFVRTNYEPNEYPSSMERLYRWTPDECIPEFFTDPTIFKSIHDDMPDLAIPEWASSPADFISIHMAALESEQVSKYLHHWIDLTFGYLLSGEAAIKAKNLALVDTSVPRTSGIVQLFTKPHPHKKIASTSFVSAEPIIKFNEVSALSQSTGESSSSNILPSAQTILNSITQSVAPISLGSNSISGGGNAFQPISSAPSSGSSASLNQQSTQSLSASTGIISKTGTLRSKKEDSAKTLAKFLPSLFNNSNNNSNNNNSNDNSSTSDTPTSTKSLVHSKSEEGIGRRYSGHKNQGTPVKEFGSHSDNAINLPTSPTSPTQSQGGFMSPQLDGRMSPQTVSMSSFSADLPITHIIEPLPADLDFDLYDYERLSNPGMYESTGMPSSSVNAPNTGDFFLQDLFTCESTLSFIQSFQSLAPIYRPMEYDRSQQQQQPGSILSYLGRPKPTALETMKANDMYAIGCIIAELYQGAPLFNNDSIVNHFTTSTPTASSSGTKPSSKQQSGGSKPTHSQSLTFNLPTPIRELVDSLVHPNPEERLKPKQVLASPIFPSYFKQMYHFLCHYHSLHTYEEKLTFTLANIGIVTSLPNEAMDLILPFILELFYQPTTKVSALVDLLDPLSQRLGPLSTQTYLLPCVINLYQLHDDHLLQCHLIQIPLIDMIISRFGRDIYIHHILPFFLDSVKTNPRDNPNHEMITTALIYISKVLGIPLTIRHIMYPLLIALTKPYLQHITEPLIAIASSLGESIIVKFYFPAIFILIKHSSKSPRSESIPCTLLGLLQELILLVKPGLVLRSLLKDSNQLASLLLNPPNPSVLIPLSETILRVAKRIGVNNTKLYILKYLQQFYYSYSDIYTFKDNGLVANDSNKQLRAIYSPEMTYHLYFKMSRVIGIDILRSEISDNALIEHIMMLYIKENNIKVEPMTTSNIPPYVSDEGLFDDVEPTLNEKISLTYVLDDYQDYDGLITEQAFNMEGNVVAFYKEHSAAVKSIAIAPSETIFATGSKDNLVKIWSPDTTKSRCTYNQHLHTVHTVHFVSSLVASCDSTSIHIWDAESKVKVNVFVEPTGSFSCFEPITNKYLVASSSESTLSFLDLNLGVETHSWVLPYQGGSSIRCITTSNDHFIPSDSNSLLSNPPNTFPSWIAAGSSSGIITVLDTRTGSILDSWKTEGPIIKLIGQNSRYLVSSSEKSVIQWDLQTSPPTIVKMWKGFKDSINSLALWQDDLIASSGTKLSSMSLVDDLSGSYGSTFRAEGIKLNTTKQSNILSTGFLPLHHILLAGTEDGHLKMVK